MIDVISSHPTEDKDETYDNFVSLLRKDEGDPSLLETIDESVLQKHADFLLDLYKYKRKVDKQETISAEDHVKFSGFMEAHGVANTRRIALIRNMKDVAYHKYLRLTRGKMPSYEYKFDRGTGGNDSWKRFQELKKSTLEGPERESFFDVYLGDNLFSGIYIDNGSDNIYKSSTDYDGLVLYLKYIKDTIENRLDKNEFYRYDADNCKLGIIEFKYMLEVATAVHNTKHKTLLSDMIKYCEEVIKTAQEKSFEARRLKKEHEKEMADILDYCNKKKIRLDDIIKVFTEIDLLKKAQEVENISIAEGMEQLKTSSEKNKKSKEIYEQVIRELISQSKWITFSNNHKISDELFQKIRRTLEENEDKQPENLNESVK